MVTKGSLASLGMTVPALGMTFLLAFGACTESSGPGEPVRTWRMGFSAIPPRLDFDLLIRALDLWSTRADAAIMHISVPWKGLIDGLSPDSLLTLDGIGLAQDFASKQLALTVMIDATDGLNRAAVAPELVAAGRSTVQVETAWGRLQGGTQFIGVERDFTDFPFIEVLGLSSYPCLGGFAEPEQIPFDYYTRVRGSRAIPMLVVEGAGPPNRRQDSPRRRRNRPVTSGDRRGSRTPRESSAGSSSASLVSIQLRFPMPRQSWHSLPALGWLTSLCSPNLR